MADKKIGKNKVKIESLIDNFDEDSYYYIQNIGGIDIVAETIENGNTNTNIINNTALYKKDSDKEVYLKTINGRGTISIQKAQGSSVVSLYLGSAILQGSGGGEGTTNYNDLSNKPKINNTTLSGNQNNIDLKIAKIINTASVQIGDKTVPDLTDEDIISIFSSYILGKVVYIKDANGIYYNVIQSKSDKVILQCNLIEIEYTITNSNTVNIKINEPITKEENIPELETEAKTIVGAINELKESGGTTYNAGEGIKIEEDTINNTGLIYKEIEKQVINRTTFEEDVKFGSIAYGNNIWVAVGSKGKIAYSNNGMDWELTDAPTQDLVSVEYIDFLEKFIALEGGTSSFIWLSSDGINWVDKRISVGSRLKLKSICSSNDTILITSDTNAVFIGTNNATQWSLEYRLPGDITTGWGPCLFDEVSYNFYILNETTGAIFMFYPGEEGVDYRAPNIGGYGFIKVNEYFITCKSNRIHYSKDLSVWNEITIPVSIASSLSGLGYFNNEYYACGTNIIKSKDLITWEPIEQGKQYSFTNCDSSDKNICFVNWNSKSVLSVGQGIDKGIYQERENITDKIKELIGTGGSVKYLIENTREKTIEHNLNTFPKVVLLDDNNQVFYGDIEYTNENTIKLSFDIVVSGTAILYY